jgi:hypothetical protein
MGARLRVFISQEQDKTLLKLRTADVPQKVKDRAEVIRLTLFCHSRGSIRSDTPQKHCQSYGRAS